MVSMIVPFRNAGSDLRRPLSLFLTQELEDASGWDGGFVRHARFHVHFTRTSASWLNPVDRRFAASVETNI